MIPEKDAGLLAAVAKSYAVANTPLFLARKIKEFAPTRYVGQRDGKQTLETLKQALSQVPSTPEEEVAPYFYAVALSFSDDKTFFWQAANLAAPHHRWYGDICSTIRSGQVLTSQFQVTTKPTLIVT